MANVDMSGYVDVAERIRTFRERFPEGSLQPVNPAEPYVIATVGDKAFVVYAAAAYRTPDDPRPGIGVAWEPLPGRTPYTRDSELMNAETSAWGRAIVAALAGDTQRIASAEEVRNRQETPKAAPPDPAQVLRAEIHQIAKRLGMGVPEITADFAAANGGESIRTASVERLAAYRDELARR